MKKLFIPPVLIVYCILSMIALHLYVHSFNAIIFPFNLMGFFIAFSGFVLMGKARDLFKKHATTLKIETSSQLIDEGIFSRTRNPMYIGMSILILGFSVLSTNLLSLFLSFLFLLLVRLVFIPKEEQLMVETFGEDYLRYKRKVRRWI